MINQHPKIKEFLQLVREKNEEKIKNFFEGLSDEFIYDYNRYHDQEEYLLEGRNKILFNSYLNLHKVTHHTPKNEYSSTPKNEYSSTPKNKYSSTRNNQYSNNSINSAGGKKSRTKRNTKNKRGKHNKKIHSRRTKRSKKTRKYKRN